MKKTQLAAAIAIAVSGAVIAPQASAGDHKGMQSQINALSSMMKSMQKELKRVKSAGGSQSLQEWENTVNAVKELSKQKDMVRFSGGWAKANDGRGGWGTNSNGTLAAADGSEGVGTSGDPLAGKCIGGTVASSCESSDSGWDFGMGFDHHISDDGILGLIPGSEFYAEIMINYSEYSDDEVASAVTGNPVTVNEISISAAPKLKLSGLQDTLFGIKPWIIPVGAEINIISPPSGSVSVTSIGTVHAVGIEYNVLGNLYVGGEGRYHWSPDDVDGVDTDGFTVGGTVGFGF